MADDQEDPVDYAVLAEFLTALGNPVRLELLKILRFAHTLSEIRVRPHRRTEGLSEDRTLARQTVQEHLDRLVEKDLVKVAATEKGGREVPLYAVNPARFYALIEDLRTLSTIYAGRGMVEDHTGTLRDRVESDALEGPRLVLVHGVYEAKAYPLDDATATDGRWRIGRDEELEVALDYDPYVSREHAEVTRTGRRFVLADLESKNATRVNWLALPKGGRRELRPGDVVGVGRSLLVFASD